MGLRKQSRVGGRNRNIGIGPKEGYIWLGTVKESETVLESGLRQQNLSNLATTYLITHFDVVFSPSPPSQSSSISSQLHQHIQFGLLKSATSLNSLLQRRRRSGVVSRRSMVTATSTEETMAVTSLSVSGHVGGGSRSRPISPRGDTASPLLSPHAIDSSCLVAHSASSLSLSPSRKWQYSDAEENDLGTVECASMVIESVTSDFTDERINHCATGELNIELTKMSCMQTKDGLKALSSLVHCSSN
ncbi:hypothetical protein ACTXT7_002931 [Hymenolepis weldensis]